MTCISNKRSIEEISNVEEMTITKKNRFFHFEDFLSLGTDVAALIFSFLVDLNDPGAHNNCRAFLTSSSKLFAFALSNSVFMDIFFGNKPRLPITCFRAANT